MLKKRIGASLIVKDNWIVQSIGFNKYLPVGRPEVAVEFLNSWGIDEIILLDISATKRNAVISGELVARAAKFCRVPLAVGGGINSLQEMDGLLQHGADKICLNQALFSGKELLREGARLFGDQCMVAVIDFVKDGKDFLVYDYPTRRHTGKKLADFAKELEDAGAGELLLQSVDKDGSYLGFENAAYKEICSLVNIPVIALGGAGNAGHFIELFRETDVSAACAGNIFHFTEHSVNMLKAQLVNSNCNVRLETHANYKHNQFDDNGRLLKAEDQFLEDLLFVRIEKEVI